jgi:casein kinase 1
MVLIEIPKIGFPKVYWFGAFEDKTVMVMELLSFNLEELLNMSNRVLCLKSMLMLIDQMVRWLPTCC